MDKRKAKRDACWRAAGLIQDSINNGWPQEHYEDEADQRAVEAALKDLIAELERRGPS